MLDAELSEKSMELEEITSNITNNRRKVIEYENNISILHAVATGDEQENSAIAKVTNPKGKNMPFEGKCNSLLCCMTIYDESPIWVTCGECNKAFHTFCEGHSVSEEIVVYQSDQYFCLQCTSKVTSIDDSGDSGRRSAVVKRVEHISTIVFVNI